MRSKALECVLSSAVLVGSFACSPAAPTFTSSYRPPTAEPLDMKGEPVAAVVLMYDQPIRQRAESALARGITERGARGLAMYQLLPNAEPDDEDAARAAFERAGVQGVVVMRPRKAQRTVVTPPSTYSLPTYYGYWGGYYSYGWNNVWGAPDGPDRVTHGPQEANPYSGGVVHDPGRTDVYDVIRVEILIYSLKQNQLVWAGEAETTEPGTVDAFIEDLVEGTADELKRFYLVPS
jgi:hypothetical protein